MIKSFKNTFKQYICIVLCLACVVALFTAFNHDTEAKGAITTEVVGAKSTKTHDAKELAEGVKTVTESATEAVAASQETKVSQGVEQATILGAETATVLKEATTKAIPTSPYADLLDEIDDYDRETLTRLIYHESRGNGGEAVAEVVLNRMLSDQFPDSLQEVVYERNQFSPANILFSATIKEPDAFDDCERIVEEVLDPHYERSLPNYYLYFNSIGPNSDDYCWLGGNVFYGYPSDAV